MYSKILRISTAVSLIILAGAATSPAFAVGASEKNNALTVHLTTQRSFSGETIRLAASNKGKPATRNNIAPVRVQWTLDTSKEKYVRDLTKVEQNKFDTFKNAIRGGSSPQDAANLIGGANCKVMDKKTNQCQIRLSGSNRVTFIADNDRHIVYIRDVGGHT